MSVRYLCPCCGKVGLGEPGRDIRHDRCGGVVRIERAGDAGHLVYPVQRGDKPGALMDEQGNLRRER